MQTGNFLQPAPLPTAPGALCTPALRSPCCGAESLWVSFPCSALLSEHTMITDLRLCPWCTWVIPSGWSLRRRLGPHCVPGVVDGHSRSPGHPWRGAAGPVGGCSPSENINEQSSRVFFRVTELQWLYVPFNTWRRRYLKSRFQGARL